MAGGVGKAWPRPIAASRHQRSQLAPSLESEQRRGAGRARHGRGVGVIIN